MTIRFVAQIIEEIFYAGRVKSDRKLTKDDFIQYGKTAFANIIRVHYFNLNNVEAGAGMEYVANLMQTKSFDLPAPVRHTSLKRKLDLQKTPLMPLPSNSNVFRIAPVDYDEADFTIAFVRSNEEDYYRSPEFSHLPFAVVKGKYIDLYNIPEQVEKVDVEGLWDDDNLEVPADVAFDVINQVLGMTLKVAGFPIDKTDDANPNVTTVKQRLADDQGV